MNQIQDKQVALRRKGGYLLAGSALFALHGMLNFSDFAMQILIFAVSLAYVLFFQDTGSQQPARLMKRLYQWALGFVGLVVVVTLIGLLIFWLSRLTGVGMSFLIAMALMLAGVVMVAWSYRN